MKIHIGNLAYDVTEEDLRQEFAAFGLVTSVDIIKDRMSGRSRGFAFVEMESESEGQAAITGLKGKMLKERTLDVTEAHPRTESRSGSYRGGGAGGRRGGFSGGRQRR